MDLIQIAELVGAAVGGGWISHLFSVRSKVRQEKAGADKAETEVKADQIENIRKTMDDVYKPIIDDLKRQVSELRDEVREVREENERLKDENDQLRDAIREIDPNIVPSRRSVNAQRQARGANGQFAKKEEK
jgi:peptidoglycan hydrolase CwlO-like protein